MPQYRYVAVNGDGQRIKNTIEAADESTAAARLRQQGITVIQLDEKPPGSGGGSWSLPLGGVRKADLVLFFRMFSALVNSNVPISEAIGILHDQTGGRAFKAVLKDVQQGIEGGLPLSQAMAAHPRVFDTLLTGMVRAAEMGGILDSILERIATFMESQALLKRKLVTSMIYPGIVALVAVGTVVFLVSFVIPKFATLLGGGQMPANTQFLLDVSTFVTQHAVMLVGFALGSVALAIVSLKLPETRELVHRYRVFVPVLGPVFRFSVVVQFSTTLAALLKSGITVVDGLKAANETVSDLNVRRKIDILNDKVAGGEPLSMAMAQDRFFPPMVLAMVQVGEYSGLMDEAWETIGSIFEKLLSDRIARMSAMMEPLLMLVLGGIVGYVAWGLIAGMMAMYKA